MATSSELEAEFLRRQFDKISAPIPMPKRKALTDSEMFDTGIRPTNPTGGIMNLPDNPLAAMRAEEAPKTVGDSIMEGIGNVLDAPVISNVIDALSVGNYISANVADNLVKADNPLEAIGGAVSGVGEGIWAGISGDDEQTIGFGDVIRRVQEEKLGIDPNSEEARAWQLGGGLTGDILLDPLTYLTLGAAKGAGSALKNTRNYTRAQKASKITQGRAARSSGSNGFVPEIADSSIDATTAYGKYNEAYLAYREAVHSKPENAERFLPREANALKRDTTIFGNTSKSAKAAQEQNIRINFAQSSNPLPSAFRENATSRWEAMRAGWEEGNRAFQLSERAHKLAKRDKKRNKKLTPLQAKINDFSDNFSVIKTNPAAVSAIASDIANQIAKVNQLTKVEKAQVKQYLTERVAFDSSQELQEGAFSVGTATDQTFPDFEEVIAHLPDGEADVIRDSLPAAGVVADVLNSAPTNLGATNAAVNSSETEKNVDEIPETTPSPNASPELPVNESIPESVADDVSVSDSVNSVEEAAPVVTKTPEQLDNEAKIKELEEELAKQEELNSRNAPTNVDSNGVKIIGGEQGFGDAIGFAKEKRTYGDIYLETRADPDFRDLEEARIIDGWVYSQAAQVIDSIRVPVSRSRQKLGDTRTFYPYQPIVARDIVDLINKRKFNFTNTPRGVLNADQMLENGMFNNRKLLDENDLLNMGINPQDHKLIFEHGVQAIRPWDDSTELTKDMATLASYFKGLDGVGKVDSQLQKTADTLMTLFGLDNYKDLGRKIEELSKDVNYREHQLYANNYAGYIAEGSQNAALVMPSDPVVANRAVETYMEEAVTRLVDMPAGPQLMEMAEKAIMRAYGGQATEVGPNRTLNVNASVEKGVKGARINENFNTHASMKLFNEILKISKDDLGKALGYKKGVRPSNAEIDEYLSNLLHYTSARLMEDGIDFELTNMAPQLRDKTKYKRVFTHEATVRISMADIYDAMPKDLRYRYVIGLVDSDRSVMLPSQIFDVMEMLVRSATRLDDNGNIDMNFLRINVLATYKGEFGNNIRFNKQNQRVEDLSGEFNDPKLKGTKLWHREIVNSNSLDERVRINNLRTALERIAFDGKYEARGSKGYLEQIKGSVLWKLFHEKSPTGTTIANSANMTAEKLINHAEALGINMPLLTEAFKGIDADFEAFLDAMTHIPEDKAMSPLVRLLQANMANTSIVTARVAERAALTTMERFAELRNKIANGSTSDRIKALANIVKDDPDLPRDVDKVVNTNIVNETLKGIPEDTIIYSEKLDAIDPAVAKPSEMVEAITKENNKAIEVDNSPEVEEMFNAVDAVKPTPRPARRELNEEQQAHYDAVKAKEAEMGRLEAEARKRNLSPTEKREIAAKTAQAEKVLENLEEKLMSSVGGITKAQVRAGRARAIEESANSFMDLTMMDIDSATLRAFNPVTRHFMASFGHEFSRDSVVAEMSATSQIMAKWHAVMNQWQKSGLEKQSLTKTISSIQSSLKNGEDITDPKSKMVYDVLREVFETGNYNFYDRIGGGTGGSGRALYNRNIAKAFEHTEFRHLLVNENPKSMSTQDIAETWLEFGFEDPYSFISKMVYVKAKTSFEVGVASHLMTSFASDVPKPGYVRFLNEQRVNDFATLLDKNKYYPKEIITELPFLNRIMREDRTITSAWAKNFIPKVFDPLISFLKMTQTTLKPGHHVMSVIGDAWRNQLLTGSAMTQEYKDMFGLLKTYVQRSNPKVADMEFISSVKGLGGVALNYDRDGLNLMIANKPVTLSNDSVIDLMERYGVALPRHAGGTQEDLLTGDMVNNVSGGSTTLTPNMDKFKAITEKVMDAKFFNGANAISSYRDTYMRGALFLHFMRSKRFRSVEEAAEFASAQVKRISPVAADLANGEAKVARRVIFYYTWIRGITPRVIELLLTKPGLSLVGNKMMYEMAQAGGMEPQSFGSPFSEDMEGNLPNYYLERVLGPQWRALNGDAMGISLTHPTMDVLNTWGSGVALSDSPDKAISKVGTTLIGMASPWIKSPYELVARRKLDSGAPIDSVSQYAIDNIGPLRALSKGFGKTVEPYTDEEGFHIFKNRTESKFRDGMTMDETWTNLGHEAVNFFLGPQLTNYDDPNNAKTAEFQRKQELTNSKKEQERRYGNGE